VRSRFRGRSPLTTGHDLPARGNSHPLTFSKGSRPKFLVRIAPTAMELVLQGRLFGECRTCSSVCRLSFGRAIHSRMIFRRISWSSISVIPLPLQFFDRRRVRAPLGGAQHTGRSSNNTAGRRPPHTCSHRRSVPRSRSRIHAEIALPIPPRNSVRYSVPVVGPRRNGERFDPPLRGHPASQVRRHGYIVGIV
jgi:hypothetical protein